MNNIIPAFISSLPSASGSFNRLSIKADPENNGSSGFKQDSYQTRVYKFYHYKSSLWGGIENSSDKSLVGIVLMDLNNRSKTKPDLIWLWMGQSCTCKCFITLWIITLGLVQIKIKNITVTYVIASSLGQLQPNMEATWRLIYSIDDCSRGITTERRV